ncbi:MAG: beta-ketoacyl-[acyl-carrier-protein] synthase family protein [Bacteroidota bacterium]
MNKRVVITGMGVVAPNGTGIHAFSESLKKGISGIRFIQELQDLEFGCRIGGIPDESDSPWLPVLEKYGLNTASDIIRYALIAALEAWQDAGLEIPEYNSRGADYDTGCIIGSAIGSADIFGSRIIPMTNGKKIKKLRSTIVEHSMISGAGANLAGILAIGNQVTSNSSACSTGTEALILGYERIKEGKALRMVVGGSDAYSPFGWAGFDAMRVLARKYNETPEKGSRPMSETADGFVPGAGAGILVIEEYGSALKRKAKIYAEIAGGHINCGGHRQGGTMTAPNPEGVIRCIRQAIRDAGIQAGDIDYISGHLSSTMADVIETENWCKALGRYGKDFPWINSLKSMTGHCIGAAGALETISAVVQMNGSFIHPSLNCEDLHPAIAKNIDITRIPMETHNNIPIRVAAKASFGFGDVNSCIILIKIV